LGGPWHKGNRKGIGEKFKGSIYCKVLDVAWAWCPVLLSIVFLILAHWNMGQAIKGMEMCFYSDYRGQNVQGVSGKYPHIQLQILVNRLERIHPPSRNPAFILL
jgi:hypothetical protein